MNEQVMTAGETAIQRFEYQGNAITFNTGDGIMVNASEMARPFGKRVNDWLRLAATREFLKALAELRGDSKAGIPAFAENQHVTEGDGEPMQANPTDFVKVMKGSPKNGGGTWMHEDVAMEFARWLSPKFAIWCNDRIKELLRDGYTRLRNDNPSSPQEAMLQMMEQNTKMLGQMVDRFGTMVERLMEAPSGGRRQTRVSRGSAEEKTYSFSVVARLLEFTGYNDLIAWLLREGVLMQEEGVWVPTPQYEGRGWFDTRWYNHGDGSEERPYTVVTQSGFRMLYNYFNYGNVDGLSGVGRKEARHE